MNHFQNIFNFFLICKSMLKVVAKKSYAVKHDSHLSKRHEIWLWNVTFLKCYFFNLPRMYFTYCSHTSKVICFKFEIFPFERYEIFTVCRSCEIFLLYKEFIYSLFVRCEILFEVWKMVFQIQYTVYSNIW
jgi:hypothetical protein